MLLKYLCKTTGAVMNAEVVNSVNTRFTVTPMKFHHYLGIAWNLRFYKYTSKNSDVGIPILSS